MIKLHTKHRFGDLLYYFIRVDRTVFSETSVLNPALMELIIWDGYCVFICHKNFPDLTSNTNFQVHCIIINACSVLFHLFVYIHWHYGNSKWLELYMCFIHLHVCYFSARMHVVADRSETGNTKMTVKGHYVTQIVNV